MDNRNLSSQALLSNEGDMTSFRFGKMNIRFRTPKCLKRYTVSALLDFVSYGRSGFRYL